MSFFFTLIIYTPSSPPFPSFFFAAPSSIFIIHKENHVTYVEREGSAMTKGRIFDDGDAWGREEAKIVD